MFRLSPKELLNHAYLCGVSVPVYKKVIIMVCVCVCVRARVCVCACVRTWVGMYVCIYKCTCVYVYVCIGIYVCMYYRHV